MRAPSSSFCDTDILTMKLRSTAVRQLKTTRVFSRPTYLPQTLVPFTRRSIVPQSRRSFASVSAAELKFGQPVHETHPHILGAGEGKNFSSFSRSVTNTNYSVTPGITAQEYADRRAKLAASLPDNGIAILAAADTKYRSGVVFYEYHQDSNFFYLTGFNEPDAVAVIQNNGASKEYTFHLFVRPKDVTAEQWDGARSGEQAALDVFNADEVLYLLQSTKPKPHSNIRLVGEHQQLKNSPTSSYR